MLETPQTAIKHGGGSVKMGAFLTASTELEEKLFRGKCNYFMQINSTIIFANVQNCIKN